MGLGLYIASEIPQKGLFRKRQKNTDLFNALSVCFKEQLPEMIQSHIFVSNRSEDKLSLAIHPAEEPVEFEIQENILVCSAKTNSAGPGYHAFVVEALETVGKKTGLDWQWQDPHDEYGDEAGYYKNRDFLSLQEEMLKWLQSLARQVIQLQEDENENLMISLPLGYSISGQYFAASPLGFWDKTWFADVAKSSLADLRDHGRAFFPWWDKGFGADFWLKCGLTEAWVHLPWHTYVNEKEEKDLRFVLECFHKAKNLDGKIELPEAEISKLKEYLNKDLDRSAPKADGIGFKKRSMARKLTGPWTIKIPGYYYEALEKNDETNVYWFGDRTIRGSSITMQGKDGKPATAENILRNKPEEVDIINFEKDHLKGWAQIGKTKEEGEDYWCLHGETATTNNVCIVTICFDKETDRDWAIETWRSVYMPKPDMEQ